MRLAYICNDVGVPVYGTKGCSVHVQEMLRALRKHGVDVELFAVTIGGEAPPGLEDLTVHPLPTPRGDRTAREQAALANNDRLRTQLDRHGPFDMIYERHSLWSYAAMEHAVNCGIPGLLEVNAPLVEEQARHRGLIDRAGAERAAVRAFTAADYLLAVSREVAQYLNKAGAEPGRIHVVPNGVDINRFSPHLFPTPLSLGENFVVGFVGTLKPWHGLEGLIEAFARLHQRHHDTELLIVGDGPQRPAIERQLKTLRCSSRVHLTGAMPPPAVPGLIAAMDVAVAPYAALDDFYFSPLKVYEYMAAGRPVITSGIGQLAELFVPGVNGLLYPAGDVAALTNAMAQLYAQPALRHRLGQAARETVLRGHTWDQIAARVIALTGSHRADVHGATIHRTLSH